MRQLLTAAVVALSLAGIFAAAAAQSVQPRVPHSNAISSTPSGGGQGAPASDGRGRARLSPEPSDTSNADISVMNRLVIRDAVRFAPHKYAAAVVAALFVALALGAVARSAMVPTQAVQIEGRFFPGASLGRGLYEEPLPF